MNLPSLMSESQNDSKIVGGDIERKIKPSKSRRISFSWSWVKTSEPEVTPISVTCVSLNFEKETTYGSWVNMSEGKKQNCCTDFIVFIPGILPFIVRQGVFLF